jgi:hypothetical protein
VRQNKPTTKAKAARKAPRRTLRDRSRLPIGSEAILALELLRTYGADPTLVPRPGIDPETARQDWVKARSRTVSVPKWALDYWAAIIKMIPPPRTKSLSADRRLTESVQTLMLGGGSVADNARLVATLHLRGAIPLTEWWAGKDADADAIDELAEQLARRVYRRRRKRDVPKSE